MTRLGQQRLPYTAEVEWIESPERDKTKYRINTNFIPSARSKIQIRFSATADSWQYNGCGGNNTGTQFRIRSNSQSSVAVEIGDKAAICSVVPFDLITLDAKNKLVQIGSVVTRLDNTSFNGGIQPFQLFTLMIDSSYIDYPCQQQLKSFKAWEDDTLQMDLIAVRFMNEDGVSEGAMYDKVSRKLFRNIGSGNFNIGPDIRSQ